VAVRSTVLSKDDFHGLLHLKHIDLCAGIESLLNHGLIRTGLSSEGSLQGLVGAQARVDLIEAVSARQNGYKCIVELLDGTVPDSLLLDVEVVADSVEELQRADLQAKSGQRGMWSVVQVGDMRSHLDIPPVAVLLQEEFRPSRLHSIACSRRHQLLRTKFRYVVHAIGFKVSFADMPYAGAKHLHTSESVRSCHSKAIDRSPAYQDF
jgi:hypothetical protein